MFQELIEDFRTTYQNINLSLDDFTNILDQFGRIDIRCQLESNVKEQIYSLLLEKQDGKVTYQAIETLIFEFLIQQEPNEHQQQINQEKLGEFAKTIPIDMLEGVTNDFLLQLKNFYKLIANKYGSYVDFRELDRLGKELQRSIKINSLEILRFIQPFVDQQQKVKIQDVLELCNDLEKMLNELNRNLQPQKQIQKQTSQQLQKEQNNSSDEESTKPSAVIHSAPFERRNFTNIIYQQTDVLRQKFVNKQGINCLNDINKATQNIEQYIGLLVNELETKTKKLEELLIEKELTGTALQQFEMDLNSKDQQIQILLQDNDFFQNQMNIAQDQCDDLKIQLNKYNEQLKSITAIETELKSVQIDNKNFVESIQKQKNEIERLQSNNKSLMEIISELESKLNEQSDQKVENTKQIIQIQRDEEELQELKDLNQQLEQSAVNLEKQKEGLELQIVELKREVIHYKKMYENMTQENQILRTSIMPRQSVMMGQQFGLGRMSKMSIGAGGISQSKIISIGRTSSQRMSSIKPPQHTVFSHYNPLDDVQGELKIEECQSPDKTNIPPIQLRVPPRIQSKYEKTLVQSIVEVDEDQAVNQTELNGDKDKKAKGQKNSLLENFNKFWNEVNQGNQQQQQQLTDPKCIQFDENILYSRDFLGIRDDQKIVEILKAERKVHNSIIQRCFSDSIYRIDSKGKRARRVFFITEHNFYIFEGEKKPGKLTRQFPIINIHTVVLSEASPVLCCLKISGSDDYLIETFKRSELNSYLTEIFGSLRAQLFRVDFLASFKIKFKGVKDPIPIEQVSQRQGYLDQGKASAFKVSSKQGWLQMFKKKMFQGDWQEVFAMLTNVGLILFKKPGDLEPILFVSIVDAIVIKNPIYDTAKQHLLKIRYESSDFEFVFSTTSAALLDQWHDVIQQTIMEQVKQQNKYLEFQQQQVVEQRTLTLIEQSETIEK